MTLAGVDMIVAGALALNDDVVTTGPNKVSKTGTSSPTSTSGFINGALQRTLPNSGSVANYGFPVGNSLSTNVTLSLDDTASAVFLVRSVAGDHPQPLSGIDQAQSVNTYWQISLVSGSAIFSGNSVLSYAGSVDAGVTTSQFIVRRWGGATWSSVTSSSPTASSINITGLSTAALGDFAVGEPNESPVVTLPGGGLTVLENAAATIIDGGATVTDPDATTDFASGTLTIDYSVGGGTQDVLAIRNQGVGAGQIGVSGANVTFAGTTIGTFTGGTAGTSLVITLNASATTVATQALARNITYNNTSDTPTATRTVRFVLTDGDGGTSAPATKVVTVTAVNDTPVANFSPAGAQTIVRGQSITSSSVLASDVDNTGTQLSATTSFNFNGGSFGAGLPSGLSLAAGAGNGTVPGSRSWTLSGSMNVTPGTYVVRVTVSDGSASTNADLTIVVNKAATSTTITSDLPDPSVVDETYTVTWTVVVDLPGAGTPTGTVTVSDGDGNSCVAAVAAGTCDLASTSHGPKTLGATYSGDADFLGSGDTETHTVIARATSTVVDCAPAAIVVDETTTCTATVTDIDPLGSKSDPSGTITFSLPDAIAPVDLGAFDSVTCSLASDGVAGTFTSTCSVDYTPSAKGDGFHTVGAAYGGSTVHATSSDTDGVTVTVDHRATSTSVDCASPVVVGQASLCTVTVTDAAGAGAASDPAGSVAFSGEGPGGFDSTTCALVSDGVAGTYTSACSVTYTPTARGDGSHRIDAAYSHSGDIHADSADGNGFELVVNKAATSTTITSDLPDPSVVDETYTVTWTVVVDLPGAGTPTGTVTVSDGDGNSCVAAVAAGTCDLASTSHGPKTLGATYSGDADFLGSGDTETHTVIARATSTVVDCAPAAIVVDETTTCTATVTDIDPLGSKSDPSGTITFSLPDAIAPVDLGAFDSVTCSLASDGVAGTFTSTCSVDYTPSAKGDGFHTVGAAYGGSTVHATSSDTDGVTVTVDHRATSTSVDCAPASIAAGESTSCTVVVSDVSSSGTASDPSGVVTFATDATGTFDPDATCTLASDGVGGTFTSSCSVTYEVGSAVAAGTHNISATYVPDLSDGDVHSGSTTSVPFAVTVTTSADLSIVKTGPAAATAGAAAGFDYTITVTNGGPSDNVGGFSVTDTLPGGLTFQAIGSDADCSAVGQVVTCTNTAGLAAGANDAFIVHVTLAQTSEAGTTLSNTATVTSTGTTDPASGNNISTAVITTVNESVSISAVKAFQDVSVVAGTAGLTFTIAVTNGGPSEADNVAISDTVDPRLVVTGAAGPGFACTNGDLNPQTITCSIANLASGATATLTVTYSVAASTPAAATVNNSASVVSEDGGSATSNIASVAITTSADLSVIKTDSADTVAVGDPFTYSITVTNNGPSSGASFIVTDVLPMEVSFASASAGCVESPVGTVTCTGSALAVGATQVFTITVNADLVGMAMNTATISGQSPADPNGGNNADGEGTNIVPGTLLSDVATGDPSWEQKIDGVDVLFQKSGSSTYVLKATNPGTFRYGLDIQNETGLDLHIKNGHLPNIIRRGVSISDSNGGSTTVYLTVPSMPASTGTPYPLTAAQKAEPAFQLTGWKPVRAYPGEHGWGHHWGHHDWDNDGDQITVTYIPGNVAVSDCATATGYIAMPWNADNLVARCIRIEGLEIPRHREANIHVSYEFRWKNTQNWGSTSVDPTQLFRAGFNFKETTVITLDSPSSQTVARLEHDLLRLPAAVRNDYRTRFLDMWDNTYTGSHALGLTFAGEKMTAVGGFIFDPSGNGRPDVTVRLFKSAPSASNRCNPTYDDSTAAAQAANLAGWYTTASDGFYFIWQKDVNNNVPVGTANTLASGFKYYVALCDFTVGGTAMPFAQLYWPARSMANTLGNKEFDEEDFFVSGPTRLEYTAQPISGKTNKTLGTVKVALLDGFGNVVTVDTGASASTVALSLESGAGGTLTSSTSLTKQLVSGVATWSDLKISSPQGVYRLKADSSVAGVPNETSLPINITP